MKSIEVISYNVYAGGKFHCERRDHVIASIVGNCRSPDVICLQEVTEEYLVFLTSRLNMERQCEYISWTKIDAMLESGIEIPDSEVKKIKNFGFMAIISRWRIKSKELIWRGSWLDDGIMKCVLEVKFTKNGQGISDFAATETVDVAVYNIHTIGGTYGKSTDVILDKRAKRMEELKTLNCSAIQTVLSETDNILIMGDFNSDSSNPHVFPETAEYPENRLVKLLKTKRFSNANDYQCVDIWDHLHPDRRCFTESCKNNAFRAYLKPTQNRESKFDKIVLFSNKCSDAALTPAEIELIGDKCVDNLQDDQGRDVKLFPSDHFGLRAKIMIPFD